MKWSVLKNNECPKCLGKLARTIKPGNGDAISCRCGFTIPISRYRVIVSDAIITKLAMEESKDDCHDWYDN